MSLPSKLSAGSYSQSAWHQSDPSWQLCGYKKNCEGRSASMQGWLSWIYVRVQMRFNNTTSPLMLFTHSPQTFTLSRSEYKKQTNRGNHFLTEEESCCCMIQVGFYAVGVPLPGRLLGIPGGSRLLSHPGQSQNSLLSESYALAFGTAHIWVGHCFDISINDLNNRRFF